VTDTRTCKLKIEKREPHSRLTFGRSVLAALVYASTLDIRPFASMDRIFVEKYRYSTTPLQWI